MYIISGIRLQNRNNITWKSVVEIFFLIEKSSVNIVKVIALFQLRQLLVTINESSTMLRLF